MMESGQRSTHNCPHRTFVGCSKAGSGCAALTRADGSVRALFAN
jgi:hypothetical protein